MLAVVPIGDFIVIVLVIWFRDGLFPVTLLMSANVSEQSSVNFKETVELHSLGRALKVGSELPQNLLQTPRQALLVRRRV